MKSFTNNKPLPYNFKLKETESLFPDILESDFSREEILNFALLDYILERNNTEKELIQIIGLLSTKIQKPTNFIDEFITYTIDANKKSFLQALCKYWVNPNQNIWEEVISNFSDDKCIYYLNLMFSFLDFNTIKGLNTRDNLSNYISEIESLDSFVNIDTEITAFILETNLKFKNINNEGSKNIFDFIYEKNSYEINEKMIELITSRYSQNKFDVELLKTANYTTIKNSGAAKLIKYIALNIEFYIKTVFLKLENNCNESEEIIIEFLNNNYEDFGPELIIEIINKNQTTIQDISKITHSELWITLLQDDKVTVSWNNLLFYFKEKKSFDDVLISYLNREENFVKLKYRINKNFTEDIELIKEFTLELLISKISLKSYISLISNSSIPYSYPRGIDYFSEISIDKMKVLIENRVLTLSIENYNFINEKFADLLLIFLETNSSKFVDEVGTYELDSSIISELIDSRVFNSEQKMQILDHIPEVTLMENRIISSKVCNLLARNRKIDISIALLKDLLIQSQSKEDKIRLFNIYHSDIVASELKSIIQLLGNPYSEITEGKHPKFENNQYNLEFINHRKKDFITKSDFIDSGKFIRVHTKRKTN